MINKQSKIGLWQASLAQIIVEMTVRPESAVWVSTRASETTISNIKCEQWFHSHYFERSAPSDNKVTHKDGAADLHSQRW